MVHFVGAGPGAVDLITLRGAEYLKKADVIIYAGSLVNPALLDFKKEGCEVFDSARMTLEEVIGVIERTERTKEIVRLHTGDPSIYGAIREQMDLLEEAGIEYDSCPGVSSFCGAASALDLEYTLPGVTQTVILTRMAGKTAVPEKESIEALASHQASMVIFLSAGMLPELEKRLIEGGYPKNTAAAIVYKATWEDENKVVCTIDTLGEMAEKAGINKTALILIGAAVAHTNYHRSMLYHPEFTTGFREGKKY